MKACKREAQHLLLLYAAHQGTPHATNETNDLPGCRSPLNYAYLLPLSGIVCCFKSFQCTSQKRPCCSSEGGHMLTSRRIQQQLDYQQGCSCVLHCTVPMSPTPGILQP